MAKPEWGNKRACLSCGARFYDLNRTPVVCPKCDASHRVEDFNRTKRPRSSSAARAAAKPAAKPVVAEIAAVPEEAAEAPEAADPIAPDPTDDVELDAGGELEEAVVEAEVPTLEPDDTEVEDDDKDDDDEDVNEGASALAGNDLEEVIPRKVGTADEA